MRGIGFIATHLLLGTYFGFVLVRSGAASWYRIQEMFRFESFYMYGLFMTAVATGALSIFLIRRFGVRALDGSRIELSRYPHSVWRYALGGGVFGVGWALTGICPGPIAALVGAGYLVVLMVLAAAMLGTWTYLAVEKRLHQ
jgi:uncharacterized membrane protein YedE/YeeE